MEQQQQPQKEYKDPHFSQKDSQEHEEEKQLEEDNQNEHQKKLNHNKLLISKEDSCVFQGLRDFEWLIKEVEEVNGKNEKFKEIYVPLDMSQVFILENALMKGQETVDILDKYTVDLKKMVQISKSPLKPSMKPVVRLARAERKPLRRIRKSRVSDIAFAIIDPNKPQQKQHYLFSAESTSIFSSFISKFTKQQPQQKLQDDQQQQKKEEVEEEEQNYYSLKEELEKLEEMFPVIPVRKETDNFNAHNFFNYLADSKYWIYLNVPDFKKKNQYLLAKFSKKAIQKLKEFQPCTFIDETLKNRSNEGERQYKILADFIFDDLFEYAKIKDNQEKGKSMHQKFVLAVHSELLDSNYQQVPFKIMSFYTKEGFLYKDLNKLLREEPKKTKEQFAEEFDAFMPFYLSEFGQELKIEDMPQNIFFDFFPKDIDDQEKFQLKLYRGVQLPKQIIDDFNKKKGQLISFQEVLPTPKSLQKGCEFAGNAMFVITVVKNLEKDKDKNLGDGMGVGDVDTFNGLFALYVENITGVPGEEEFIFPSGTEFTIDYVKEDEAFSSFDEYPDDPDYQMKLTAIHIIIPLMNK